MALSLKDSVRALPGVGAARAKRLEALGILTAGDLLAWFPRTYEDRTILSSIDAAPEGAPVCVAAIVCERARSSRVRAGLEITKLKVTDGRSVMTVTFFNQSYVKTALSLGEEYIFYGTVEGAGRAREMKNPVFERRDAARFTGRIMPVYPLTAGISNHLLAGAVERVLQDCAPLLSEELPESLRLRHSLAQVEFAYRNIHMPASWEELELARRRLVFEELFYLSAGLALLKRRRSAAAGPVIARGALSEFCGLLPFSLTRAQRRAMEEAARDLASGTVMNRLVQGDVGSGKTAVAAACVFLAARAGYQSALMAPTEILARQHFGSLTALLAPAGIRVGLLTGSMKAAEKRQIRAALAVGEIDLLVGTHALLSQEVAFSRLGLVVTDEQHRFGVGQRAALSAKGGEGAARPHVLVMSATPIPRTLALIIYGDLDVSVIDELPPGRTPVETFLIREDKRERMYRFVRKLVSEGRQAYLVCPLVDEGEQPADAAGRKAVLQYTEALRDRVFSDLRLAFLHGKMKPAEKEAVMSAFSAGEIDVLVSTTVIEVGVDVPNAALMVIENADRFGLSQLHQLRGRVGRGAHKSYCVMVTDAQGQDTLTRLRALAATADGFQIAEEDLKLRGPGDFFGRRQHGLPALRVADLAGDMRLLREAQDAAGALLAEDPALEKPEHAALLGRVRALFAENPDIFN